MPPRMYQNLACDCISKVLLLQLLKVAYKQRAPFLLARSKREVGELGQRYFPHLSKYEQSRLISLRSLSKACPVGRFSAV
jgi:hypothetical protein